MFIWVPKFVEEVKGRRGLFEVDDKLGQKLIDAGVAQDPRIGAAGLDPISDERAVVKKVVRKRKTKVVDEAPKEKVKEPVQVEESAEPELSLDAPADDS